MESLIKNIQSDLDLVRGALARAAFNQNPTSASKEGIGGESQEDAKSCQRSPQRGGDTVLVQPVDDREPEALAVASAAELSALREQVAALSAVELQRSKLEAQLAARDAALRHYTQSHLALSTKEQKQRRELEQTASTLKEAEAELVMWRERHQRLQREVQVLQHELEALAAQCDRLQSSVLELRELSRRAIDDNNALRKEKRELREECETLQSVRAALNDSVAREEALTQELQALRDASTESEAYFKAAVAEVEARRQYWAAVQGQHESLLEALALTQKTAQMWEDRFASECTPKVFGVNEVPADLPVDDFERPKEELLISTTEDGGSQREVNKGGDEAVDRESASLVAALEAKVVDLALHLQEQRAEAEAAKDAYNTLAAVVERESCDLLELRRKLAAQRPECMNLIDTNTRLQAALLARESYVEALQDFVVAILDDLTGLTFHCYELEVQLAISGAATPVTVSGDGREPVARRSTALNLIQSKQQRCQESWRITVPRGKRGSKGI
ncbi:hypothetical protein, conserved [Trypanosoma brucei brucei TREU927]|uniref:SLACS retrotransposable element (Part) n=1 Tax=Trypanosoma brucei brucei (strain 927/4 GUTat10.1) TaxID=185431 RepID=Q38C16_TRYB2|nr:hypothetical protein, conserved [Trypanosoma brucei brucei TREU927]EAN77654.1 hypothetical protein, conserved [Trypanosoma brucei brucei TREU927]